MQAKGVRFASYSLPLDWALGVPGLEQGLKPHHPSHYPLSGITTYSWYKQISTCTFHPACPILCLTSMCQDEETLCSGVICLGDPLPGFLWFIRDAIQLLHWDMCAHVCECTVGDIGNVAFLDRRLLGDTLVMHNKNRHKMRRLDCEMLLEDSVCNGSQKTLTTVS